MPVVRKAWEDFILHLMMTSHELTTILLNLHGLEVKNSMDSPCFFRHKKGTSILGIGHRKTHGVRNDALRVSQLLLQFEIFNMRISHLMHRFRKI